MIYFLCEDLNMVRNTIILYVIVQFAYCLLLKLSNKLGFKTKNILDDIYGLAIFIGGVMAIICYSYHLINNEPMTFLKYLYYLYILIINVLLIPGIWSNKLYEGKESN